MRRVMFGLLAGAALMSLAGAASAQVFVVSENPSASRCYTAASKAHGLQGLAECSNALAYGDLSGHNLAGTYVNRGVIELRSGRTDEASADFLEARTLIPALGEAWTDDAMAAASQARWRDAETSADRALTLGTGHAELALYARAVARESLGDLTGAYRDYNAAVRTDPSWAMPKADLARFVVVRR